MAAVVIGVRDPEERFLNIDCVGDGRLRAIGDGNGELAGMGHGQGGEVRAGEMYEGGCRA